MPEFRDNYHPAYFGDNADYHTVICYVDPEWKEKKAYAAAYLARPLRRKLADVFLILIGRRRLPKPDSFAMKYWD